VSIYDPPQCPPSFDPFSLRMSAYRVMMRTSRVNADELAARADIPQRFHAVTALYLDSYAQRVSDHHTTMRNRAAHLARFLALHRPGVPGGDGRA
jgi:hypothetical protein